ncbi:MAG TPA: hypothetical protein VH349_00355 [Ktedonobacterales bacterium]|jgi:hypothetical protein
MPTRTLTYISLGAMLAGIVIFVASVIWRVYQLVLPAAGVTLILAIVDVIFGHRALASTLNEKSSVVLPIICLVLGYGVALFIFVWLVALILALRNFT